jgi:hypothetical protein
MFYMKIKLKLNKRERESFGSLFFNQLFLLYNLPSYGNIDDIQN